MMQKDFIVLNQKLKNTVFVEKVKKSFDRLSFTDDSVHSILLLIAGTVVASENSVSYFSNGKLSLSVKDSHRFNNFKKELSKIYSSYRKEEAERTSIIVACNFEKEVFMQNIRKNMQEFKEPQSDESPRLNVVPVEPKHTFTRMVLVDSVKDELFKAVALIKNMDKIYIEWGFNKIDAEPRCVLNFFGPPGTGKTMAAHAIANELGKKILPLNYSDIESKFWGDAPKNLASAFKIAEKEKCVLFFDEADSFLGKRITNVSSSSDQAVNSLRSQLLILLEDFTGTVIFATNLHKNYDRAFESRILRHIEFFLPDASLRAQIIRSMIPQNAPVAQDALEAQFMEKLGGIIDGFSPREIKNTVLDVLAASIYKGKDLDRSLFEEEFRSAKENFDALQDKNCEDDWARKNRVQDKIKTQLASGEYETVTASDVSECK